MTHDSPLKKSIINDNFTFFVKRYLFFIYLYSKRSLQKQAAFGVVQERQVCKGFKGFFAFIYLTSKGKGQSCK